MLGLSFIGLTLFDTILLIGGPLVGIIVTVIVLRLFSGKAAKTTIETDTIAERVRSVGKLVGLEVCAKEIATATSGVAWVPPLLLSQAKMAMIFHFERQYFVDLSVIGPQDVHRLAPGRYRLHLPPVKGDLRLTDVSPYDIQSGRVLGLLDVIQMNAARQKDLMTKAQEQASTLYTAGDSRYKSEARASVERQLRTLFALLDSHVDIVWPDSEPAPASVPPVLESKSELQSETLSP